MWLKRQILSVRYGELAQMVERSLSMREVGGSMPPFSTHTTLYSFYRSTLRDASVCEASNLSRGVSLCHACMQAHVWVPSREH